MWIIDRPGRLRSLPDAELGGRGNEQHWLALLARDAAQRVRDDTEVMTPKGQGTDMTLRK